MLQNTIILLVLTFWSGRCWADSVSSNETSGFGYELLLSKMDYLEYKFMEMQVEMKEQGESILHNQDKNKRALLEQTGDILEQQKMFANHEKLKKSIFELRPRKHPSDNSKLLACLTKQRSDSSSSNEVQKINSCSEERPKTSGKYLLAIPGTSTTFEVYCEQSLYGGGWVVIQNRFNGSVEFYRNWADYRDGFGSFDGEFWLGLEKIYSLISSKSYELLVHLEDFDGVVKYAKYGKFAIASESEKYVLELDDHSGSLKDSLYTHHVGQKFSTKDSDNDKYSGNCARERSGAWWYSNCQESNLNGLYKTSDKEKIMSWDAFSGSREGLKISKMMIRQL